MGGFGGVGGKVGSGMENKTGSWNITLKIVAAISPKDGERSKKHTGSWNSMIHDQEITGGRGK